jgi:hypothetical protein
MAGWLLALLCGVGLLGKAVAQPEDPILIYHTGFEFHEGYRDGYTLMGQNGWIGSGTGGNGIVTNYFSGGGQQAYIGAGAPAGADEEFFNVWRPIDLAPISPALPLITFSVRMLIEGSSAGVPSDDFRWSVYNTNGARLFTIDFDTAALSINVLLDDGEGFQPTGYSFETGGDYDLVVAMNFLRNRWSAWLNDTLIATARPITASGAALNLGDVDAVWGIRDPRNPGDNYMVFDDYRITADASPVFRPTLEVMGFVPNRGFTVRFKGEPALRYVIDASTDMDLWTPIKTNASPDGVFDLVDVESDLFDRQFYRARLLSP